jgi:capsular polysaccharide transport system permease protein
VTDDQKDHLPGRMELPKRLTGKGDQSGPARAPFGPHGWAGGGAKADAPQLDPRTQPGRKPQGDYSPVMRAQLERFNLRLPQHRGAPPIIATAWFIVAFVIPVLLGVVYYGLVASKQYEAEFHFTVREPLPDGSMGQGDSGSSGPNGDLSALLARNGSGAGSANTLDNYTVVDYIRSAQAARDLDQRLNLAAMYAKPGVDFLSRYGGGKQGQPLAGYWKRMVTATYDPATGLASVGVRAFDPGEAYAIATNLIDLSNGVVNGIGRRSRADSLRVAEKDVEVQEGRLDDIEKQVTALRNQIGAINPTRDAVAGNTDLYNRLRTQLTQLKGQLNYLTSQQLDPKAPQVVAIRTQIASVESQLAVVGAQVTRDVEEGVAGGGSLTGKVGLYERQSAERTQVLKDFSNALMRLREATYMADSQRLYISTFVQPAKPDSASYPKRLQSVGVLAVVCLLIWSIGVLIGKSVMDHIR